MFRLDVENLTTVVGATGWASSVLQLRLLALTTGRSRGRGCLPLGTARTGSSPGEFSLGYWHGREYSIWSQERQNGAFTAPSASH